VLAGSGLYYYVVDEYKVSNELLTEDVYVSSALRSHHIRRHTTQQLTRIASGTPICCSEARGLRQGPRAGGQVEEVGVIQEPARHDIKRRRIGKGRQIYCRCVERNEACFSSLYMYIPSSPPQTHNSKYPRICSRIEIQQRSKKKSRQPDPKRLHAT
jgi:hypothetical protein